MNKILALIGACFLVGGFVGSPDLANASDGFKMHGRTHGHCKLANVEVGKELYNGRCTIKQEIDGKSNLYVIKMGSAESFRFATSDGVTWMHGPERVKFRDRGDSGVFKWGDFRLEVHED
jgi:hypothetical protein